MDFQGFPMCANGDVLIVLAPDVKLQLHAQVLKRHSKFFHDRVIQENAATLSINAKHNKETVRWRFDLVERPGPGEGGPGKFQMVEIDSMARVQGGQRTAPPDFSGRTTPNPIYNYYAKIFGAFYSEPFNIEDKDITALLREVIGLTEVSEYLGCVHAVSRTIDAALLGQGQVLFRSIASNPTAWVDLAVRVHSASVFQEAVVHLTGQWNRLDEGSKAILNPKIRALCEAKALELDERKKHIECRVLKFYPPGMGREVGAPPRNISRMSYSNNIMDWMALGVFRHWFSSALALNRHRLAATEAFGCKYQKLAQGGNAYLSKQELKSFHERFPMSTRGEHVLEGHVNALKDGVRPLVAELMRNESQLDCERFPVDYLTCVRVERVAAQEMWESKRGELLDWSVPNATNGAAKLSVRKRTREEPATTKEAPVFEEESPSANDVPLTKKGRGGEVK